MDLLMFVPSSTTHAIWFESAHLRDNLQESWPVCSRNVNVVKKDHGASAHCLSDCLLNTAVEEVCDFREINDMLEVGLFNLLGEGLSRCHTLFVDEKDGSGAGGGGEVSVEVLFTGVLASVVDASAVSRDDTANTASAIAMHLQLLLDELLLQHHLMLLLLTQYEASCVSLPVEK